MKIGSTEVTPEIIRALQHKFNGVDVELELCRCVLYLAKNPARELKKPLRFVENWLKKCKPKLVDVSKKSVFSQQELLKRGQPRPGESWEEFAMRIRAA